ncbi:MAG: alpha-L-fucosidase [Verrucomicrobiota bacterium]|nr:alpha-L-fucosidase [Verrucomicrobiota bacterium]
MFPEEHVRRQKRLKAWFSPGRFGLFYHWGLFTGGGNSAQASWKAPLRFQSISALEQLAPDPETLAHNLVQTALKVRAQYITFTVVHSCGGWAVLFPSRVPGFMHVATRDYVGALLAEAHKRQIRCILYLPGSMGHWDSPGGPWVGEPLRSAEGFAAGLRYLVRELAEKYGSRIDGFWLDGLDPLLFDLPELMHTLLPEAVVMVNNFTRFNVPGMDCSTTEFLPSSPDPIYNRPNGLIKPIDWIAGMMPPMKDFNEDIPTCNDWWHGAPPYNEDWIKPYAYRQGQGHYQRDPLFWIREMLCSLGMRGQWNYTMGLGPLLDGTVPPEFLGMIEKMEDFMGWASESILNTTGGEGSGLVPGWCNDGAFAPVTVSLSDPSLHYVHVTQAPSTDYLRIQTSFYRVEKVEHLRTGKPVPFSQNGALEIRPENWNDVGEYGAQVFRVSMVRA